MATSKKPPRPLPPRPGPRKALPPPLPPEPTHAFRSERPTGKNPRAVAYSFLGLLDAASPAVVDDVGALVALLVDLSGEDRKIVVRVALGLKRA